MPLINHPPSVDNGFRTTVTSSFGYAHKRDDPPNRELIGPAISVAETWGWHSNSRLDALGLQGGIEGSILNGISVDGYAQIPRTMIGGLDAGAGAAAVTGIYKGPMAYVQAGGRVSRSLYVYTTQSALRLSSHQQGYPRRTTWQPTLAVEWTPEDILYGVFVTANVGDIRTSPIGEGFIAPAPLARIAIGFSRQFHPSPQGVYVPRR